MLESTHLTVLFFSTNSISLYIITPRLPIERKHWLFQYESFKKCISVEGMKNIYHRIILMGNFDISNGTSGLHNYFHIKHIGKNIAFSVRCSRRKSQPKKEKKKENHRDEKCNFFFYVVCHECTSLQKGYSIFMFKVYFHESN